MHYKIDTLERQLDDNRQQYNKNKLEIDGVPACNSENLANIVKIIGSKIGYDINENEITTLRSPTRLATGSDPSRSTTGTRPPTITVAFPTAEQRNAYLTAVKKFNRSGVKLNTGDIGTATRTPIYVQESLTPRLRYIFIQAKKAAKEKAYQFIWLKDGIIRAKKDEKSRTLTINSLLALNKM